MTRLHNSAPAGEVLRSVAAAAATFADRSTFASTPRRRFETRPAVRPEPAVLRRHPHIVRYPDVEAGFDALIDKATAAIAEDEILGHYVHVASLVRAVSFREGKLLEQAVQCLSKINPDLTALMQSLSCRW